MLELPLVILAGGKSSRMGENKALLPFGGYPTLTQYQLHRFKEHFQRVYISCRDKSVFNFEADFLEDISSDIQAPYIGIVSAFEKLKSSDVAAFLSVDVPFFAGEDFKRLEEFLNGHEGAVARNFSQHEPLCAIYKSSIKDKIKKLLEQKRYNFAPLFESADIKFVDFFDEKKFANLNTKEEYQKYFIKE
jgi:molybdopterin-guanine dinucleotide biosynthesis protein A